MSTRTLTPLSFSVLLLLLVPSLVLQLQIQSRLISAADSDPPRNGAADGFGEWQILTRHNFSSQTKLHPHVLLLVTFPWSGEARSLMAEISGMVRANEEGFRNLKLMYVYRNKERALVEAISGGAESERMVSVLYYRLSLPYRYRGGGGLIRARSLLSSVLPFVSGGAGERGDVPLKRMETREEVEEFLGSTDRSLVVFEGCGWTGKLVEDGVPVQGDPSGAGLRKEVDMMPLTWREEKQKGTDNGNFQCGRENELNGLPWLAELSGMNYITPLQDNAGQVATNANSSMGELCSLEEFQKFDALFSKFMTVARDFFLPPERHRFGLVTDRSLLSSFGVSDSGSWLAMLYVNGCPSCSRIIEEQDDLGSALLNGESIVREIEGDMLDLDPALPADEPSVLLFVDRSSSSQETRIKGNEALDLFRELALHYKTLDQPTDGKSQRYNLQSLRRHGTKIGNPGIQFAPASSKVKLAEKMSIMIVKDGKHAVLDDIVPHLEGNFLQDILTHILRKKDAAKLSSVAKEMGFQLLSDDLNIEVGDAILSKTSLESKQFSTLESAIVDQDSTSCQDGKSKTDDKLSFKEDLEKLIATHGDLLSITPDQGEPELAFEHDDFGREKGISSQHMFEEENIPTQSFRGSFFFSDGYYRLLEALTGETKIPSLVIIDPVRQQHYVFPAQTNFSYSSMEAFLSRYLNESLIPHQRSVYETESARESNNPPFVDMDFHEVDSIPQIAANTFMEQVFGINHSIGEKLEKRNSQNGDVLVLFSNSWCGFCMRMELVVGEVYRAIKEFSSMLEARSTNKDSMLNEDNTKKDVSTIPKIFLMDCTSNDCSLILGSINQRELYPALVLFPAESKKAVSYEGNMAVTDVVRFISDYGGNSHHLVSEIVKQRSGDSLEDTLPAVDVPVLKDKSFEVLLRNRASSKRVGKYAPIRSHTSKGVHETAPKVVVGSILVASEKISVQPFDNSMVLVVKADGNTGFQGLILNKPIGWDSLHQLLEGLELLKEAPLSFGGPLIKHGMPLVALTRKQMENELPEVGPGIYFLDQSTTLRKIEELKSGNQSTTGYWFFLGFSNWGWEQLFDEIDRGDWNVTQNAGHVEWPWN